MGIACGKLDTSPPARLKKVDMTATDPDLPQTRRQARGEAQPRKRRGGILLFLRDVVVIVVIALVVSFLVKTFVVRSFFIPSSSMENTLQISDHIMVDELTPRFTGYQRGDIVVFSDPGGWLGGVPAAPVADRGPVLNAVNGVLTAVGLNSADASDHLVKRVIGLPGDTVKCCNALGQIEVNGVPLDESAYLKLSPGATAPHDMPYEVTVPEGSLWVLGDNRDRSQDSRYHQSQPGAGFVPMDKVVGRAFVRTFPLDRFGGLGTLGDTFTGIPAAKVD